jgi:hypothetical protein
LEYIPAAIFRVMATAVFSKMAHLQHDTADDPQNMKVYIFSDHENLRTKTLNIGLSILSALDLTRLPVSY